MYSPNVVCCSLDYCCLFDRQDVSYVAHGFVHRPAAVPHVQYGRTTEWRSIQASVLQTAVLIINTIVFRRRSPAYREYAMCTDNARNTTATQRSNVANSFGELKPCAHTNPACEGRIPLARSTKPRRTSDYTQKRSLPLGIPK